MEGGQGAAPNTVAMAINQPQQILDEVAFRIGSIQRSVGAFPCTYIARDIYRDT